jgi:hypothetical protein
MDIAVATAPAAGVRRLAAVRAWMRARRPAPGVGRRLDFAYSVAVVAGMIGALAYGTASSTLAEVVTPQWLATFGPSLGLAALLAATRWGAYQGPVVFSIADVAFLLGAPLPRRGLATRRLVRALAGGAAAGAAVGCAAIVGLAGEDRGIGGATAAGLVVGLAELGLLGVAGAWAVERSARCERATRRIIWPTAAVAAVLAAGSGASPVGREVALWSGPWGWAMQPAAGAGEWQWLAALVVLTLVTAIAARAAIRDCGNAPAERHVNRAEARVSAVASLASFDARTARRALERVGAPGSGRRGAALRRPRAARLAVPWRDVAAALRTPGRVLEAAALAGGGTVLALLSTDRPIAVAAAMLVVYLGASRMLWPLRAELDVPTRARVLLRPSFGRVLLAHTIVPAGVTTGAAVLAAAGSALGGALATHPAAALATVAAVPMVTACAGMSARRRGKLPPSLLAMSAADPTGGGGAILAWLILWPTVAAILGAVPLLLVTGT